MEDIRTIARIIAWIIIWEGKMNEEKANKVMMFVMAIILIPILLFLMAPFVIFTPVPIFAVALIIGIPTWLICMMKNKNKPVMK